MFKSTTQNIPEMLSIPRHIAIIMDGNGRWAKSRFLPRIAGHKAGVNAVRSTIQACSDLGIEYLTFFAFSTENWRRPEDEVGFLMGLFLKMMHQEVLNMHKKNICIRFIGQRSRFSSDLLSAIESAEQLTQSNTGLNVTIAVDYGGRWDIVHAANDALKNGHKEITEDVLSSFLQTSTLPEPDLMIRTGGEKRISNFLIWQCAYTEIYFSDIFWPEFSPQSLDEAIVFYQNRERRFGRISEQL
jgi:undecaprenyl diphosphate synthase